MSLHPRSLEVEEGLEDGLQLLSENVLESVVWMLVGGVYEVVAKLTCDLPKTRHPRLSVFWRK